MQNNWVKKILIITDVFKMMAGSEKNIVSLLNHINPEKFDLSVACLISGELAREIRGKGYEIIGLKKGKIQSPNGLENIKFLREYIRKRKISLIMTYHESSDFYGLLLSKICRVPVISNRRDMGFKTKVRHKMVYKICGKYFDAIVAVSNAVKKELLKSNWFPEEKIVTIYNGIEVTKILDDNEKRNIKFRMGFRPEHKLVGVIGNLRKIKGIQFFIESAPKILRKHSEVHFLVVGDDMGEPGYTRKDLESLAKEKNVLDRIHFLGKRTDIPHIISIMDIGVVPSLSEGFSNTLLEYMASSKPVVATEVGGNGEAIVNGETGLLIPPADTEALAEAVSWLLENKEKALKFGEAGRKLVEEKFSLKKMIKNYEYLFGKVINEK